MGPPRHPTSPLLCPLQLPAATARCKRWRPQVERGSQASPKVLKLEHNATADPSEPSSTQRDSRGEPSTSATSHNCSSVPKAGRSHADDAGGKQGWSPPPQIYGGFPLFFSLWAPRCTQGLGQTPLGQRRGSRTPWGGDGCSPLSCLQHPKTKPGAWHGQVIRLIRSSGCLASPSKLQPHPVPPAEDNSIIISSEDSEEDTVVSVTPDLPPC